MNKFKEDKNKKPKKKGKSFARAFLRVMDGSFLTRDNMMQFMPFLFFLTGLAIFYIANSYYVERTVREIQSTKNELKELRSEFITTKSDLMFISKQSEVAKAVSGLGLEESRIPPKKIVVEPGTLSEN